MTTIIAILIICILLLSGCKKLEDIRVVEDINYNAEFAIPLINTRVSLQDILDSEDDISILEIDENGNMTLNYEAEFEYNSASELIGVIPSFPLVLLDTNTVIPFEVFDNVQPNSISLKSGTISFNLQSGISENINITLRIPQLTKDGLPFTTNFELFYQGSLPVTATIDPLSVEGYTLDLSQNSIEVNYEAITGSGDYVIVNLITGMAENWNYDLIKGIASQYTFNISKDTIDINLFNGWLNGDISFEDPRIAFQVENSFGIPMSAKLINVVAITSSGNEISLTTTSNSFELNYPSISEIGESKTTVFYFDKNNSNIKEIIENKPTKILYEIEGTVNPQNINEIGFITDQSNLTSLLKIELPIHGTASGFTIQTTVALDLQDIENIGDVEFKLITNNGLPIDVDFQMYFQDENENIIDSLFNQAQTVLSSATIDTNGNTNNTTEVTTFINIPKERMLMIQQANTALLNVSFSTSNNGNTPVIINSSQYVEIRMGAKIGLGN